MAVRKPLPSVALCCVDTRHADQAWYALERCTEGVAFGQTLFFCPQGWVPPHPAPSPIDLRPTPPLKGIEDYNRFMLRGLAPLITTAHVLVVQWDGFISQPGRWDESFLEWDYIGAPWYHGGSSGSVGNGGFSLRSHKLLSALEAIDHPATEPEDMAICVTLRPMLEANFGIRFAPLDVAQRFACEYGPYAPAFGFHGMHNFAHVLSPDELTQWLKAAPDDLLCTKHSRKLIKTLMEFGQTTIALDIIRRRSGKLGWSRDQCLLWLRAMAWRIKHGIRQTPTSTVAE